jgi:hypothetical protein
MEYLVSYSLLEGRTCIRINALFLYIYFTIFQNVFRSFIFRIAISNVALYFAPFINVFSILQYLM